MAKVFKRQYHLDTARNDKDVDADGWQRVADTFRQPADLYIDTMEMWNCEDFSMELLAWCEEAKVGEVFEDDDIRVTVCEELD